MIATAHLLPDLHRQLMTLLRGLAPRDWARPTVAGAWCVRDVVAHLLDVQLRPLSLQRDGYAGPPPDRDLSEHGALVAWLNALNAEWLRGSARISPRLLVDLLEVVGPQTAEFLATLDPDGPAIFPVAWAGESASRHWMDVGRDYTELWHHQAQIRLAVGAPLLESRAWLHPVLALAVRGLRRALASEIRPEGTTVLVRVSGEAGGAWQAVAGGDGWTVAEGEVAHAHTHITLPDAVAWRVWFNAMSADAAYAVATVTGDEALARAVCVMRSVMV